MARAYGGRGVRSRGTSIMGTELYVHLTYNQYKRLEKELKNFAALETTHDDEGKRKDLYHNSFRFHLGTILVEAHGPLVKP